MKNNIAHVIHKDNKVLTQNNYDTNCLTNVYSLSKKMDQILFGNTIGKR